MRCNADAHVSRARCRQALLPRTQPGHSQPGRRPACEHVHTRPLIARPTRSASSPLAAVTPLPTEHHHMAAALAQAALVAAPSAGNAACCLGAAVAAPCGHERLMSAGRVRRHATPPPASKHRAQLPTRSKCGARGARVTIAGIGLCGWWRPAWHQRQASLEPVTATRDAGAALVQRPL